MDKEERENEEHLPTHEQMMEIARKMQNGLQEFVGEMTEGIITINGDSITYEFPHKIKPLIGLSDAFDNFRKPILSKPNRTETINDNDIQNLNIELNREQEFDDFLERV